MPPSVNEPALRRTSLRNSQHALSFACYRALLAHVGDILADGGAGTHVDLHEGCKLAGCAYCAQPLVTGGENTHAPGLTDPSLHSERLKRD